MAEAISARSNSAVGVSGLSPRLLIAMSQVSVDGLAEVIRATGHLGYIEPKLRRVTHWVFKKRTVIYTKQDTRPLTLEEEVVKVVPVLLLSEADPYVADAQSAYQPGRGISGVRRGLAMLLEHCQEETAVGALQEGQK